MHTAYDLVTSTDAWHPHYKVLDDYLMEKALKHDKQIYVWTVNDEDTLRQISGYPVQGIITDEIKLVRKFYLGQDPA